MNGRLYDPLGGRFLSPDNNVQMNFNRYAYALNNSLKFAEPDGECPCLAFIIGAVIGAYMGGSAVNNDWSPWNGGWDWNDPATYFGIIGGGIAGGLGAQWLFGPGGVLAGETSFAVNVGVNMGQYASAIGQFAVNSGVVSWQGAGIATAAGGGLWLANKSFSPQEQVNNAINEAQSRLKWDGPYYQGTEEEAKEMLLSSSKMFNVETSYWSTSKGQQFRKKNNFNKT